MLNFDERPLIVFWEVTKACSLACVHCRAQATRAPFPGELSTEEGIALIADIASFGSPPPRLVLTGGDPMERPDLFDLVRAAVARGVPVAVAPAASPKITREALAALKEAGVWGVALSLDSPRENEHDAFRRSPGSYARTHSTLRDALDIGLWTQVNSVIHRGNVERLPELFQIVKALGVDSWEVIPLIPTGRAAKLAGLTAAETESVLHVLHDAGKYGIRVHAAETPASRRVALERRANGAALPSDSLYSRLREDLIARLGPPPIPVDEPLGRTRSGAGIAFVGADGSVTPSGFLPLSVANVRAASLARTYREDKLFRALRHPAGFSGKCGACEFRDVCGGSRARAFAATGDPLASDPSCVRADISPSRGRASTP